MQINNGKALEELKSNYKISEMYFDPKLGITGLKGSVLKIIDKNIEKKLNCLHEILDKV